MLLTKTELRDEGELAFELDGEGGGDGAAAGAGAGEGDLVQKGGHRPAVGRGVGGEFVAEVVEGEREALFEVRGIFHGVGEIAEQRLHRERGFEVALGVGFEVAAGGVECGVMAQTGEDVGDFAVRGGMTAGSAGRRSSDRWWPKRRDKPQRLGSSFR